MATKNRTKDVPPELLIQIFANLLHPLDLLQCALTCKAWSYRALEILWIKPPIAHPYSWDLFCQTTKPGNITLFPYLSFIRRINLSTLSVAILDDQLSQLSKCDRLERITLSGCSNLTDLGLLKLLDHGACENLVSLDLSDITTISDLTILKVAEQCPRLQGLNLNMHKDTQDRFTRITDASIVKIAKSCRGLRRIKLSNFAHVSDTSAIALAHHCPGLTEIDLMSCSITNTAVHEIFLNCRELKEFRINQCSALSPAAFTQSALSSIPPPRIQTQYFEQLRLLDLTGVVMLTDEAIQKIVCAAPKIRNLVLNKCYSISDAGLLAICELGRYLHYLHLGHCSRITDFSVVQLAKNCTRLRYLDLASCSQITDRSVTELATLPKLKRIGLVKCTNITDQSIYALTSHIRIATTLERVHLSYCSNLSVRAVMQLVTFCHRLTHLSLTHVPAFLDTELQKFCREPPRDFTGPQIRDFCVFSGKGVRELRHFFHSLSHEEREVRYPFPSPINTAYRRGEDTSATRLSERTPQ
ncbi:hypothetical protein J3Q64DRAFT_1387035 [Phycomyces blakesleeanus]|uniref:Uncharacterized protein n=2 Tax=Phycomyces blakesleeanus TaxID=4837 RepID=A0A162N6L3_PHYB8|nr:hypothetical protein PHYBLDRAFT_189330 [Phycomyces blakesleeanus NRRL 1555(-)]OAD66244.1 hypothetical protein PHYBLDRAFT_189330 [Phycomyces blakesleeanus NRRL 1555(-)]|eukprot:XP_018284284.1 hypothetical protein PHYBLDRAFT_189330 [Phycomyces blakesleeanus NRRL 1555(-)]